jgi:methionyl-tRNA formyltransferase
MKNLNVVFFGTPDFAVPCLDLLHQNERVNLLWAVTMPDRPAGRGQKMTPPPVANFAKIHNIPLFQTENINLEEDFLSRLKDVDLFIVLAFAQFLKKKVLDIPKIGSFNIHTSLLPKYRGAAPIQHALLNGDEKTGITIQKMVTKMDAGDLVLTHVVPIKPQENAGELFERLSSLCAESLDTFLNNALSNKLEFHPQDESKATFAPSFKKEDGHLKFPEKNARDLKNLVRALTPWPSAYCFVGEKRLKILSAEESTRELAPGRVEISNNQLMIGCKDGSLILSKVQLEGKRSCSGKELINGLKSFPVFH